MNLTIFVLRVLVGLLFVGHGTQKLFGWFGGKGPEGTAKYFESLEMRPGRTMALAAGATEAGGGALFALGLVTPLAATILIAVMVTAIVTVTWRNGVWITQNGIEYNLVLIAIAFMVTAVGPGAWSLDHAIGLDTAMVSWAVLALLIGTLAGEAAVAIGRGEYSQREQQRRRDPVAH